MQPFDTQIIANQPAYTVASVIDNKPFAGDAINFSSEARAREYMNQQISANANLTQQIHVIPQYEVNE
jgi:hypothetical protein